MIDEVVSKYGIKGIAFVSVGLLAGGYSFMVFTFWVCVTLLK